MSSNHDRIGTAWRREHDAAVGDNRHCAYTGLPGWGPCSGPLERHHVDELADGGSPTFTVDACRRHHQMTTTQTRRNRRQATPPGRGLLHPVRIANAATWAVTLTCLAAAVTAVWLQCPAAAGASLTAASLALYTRYRWGIRRAARLQARRRIATFTAKAMHTLPQRLTPVVDRGAWGGTLRYPIPLSGTVAYPETTDDEEGSKFRAAVEAAFAHRLGAAVDWYPQEDTLRWYVLDDDQDDDQDDAPPELETIDGAATRQAEIDSTAAALAADLIATFKPRAAKGADPASPVNVAIPDFDDAGPLRVAIDYWPGFQDGPNSEDRHKLVERVSTKTGLRFRADWEPTKNGVDLVRRPDLPITVPYPDPATIESTRRRTPLGLADHGGMCMWDRVAAPHLIVVGPTGTGKSVTLTEIIIGLILAGFRLILVDGKGTTFAPFRDWPNVIACGLADPEEMSNALVLAQDEMKTRYHGIMYADRDPESYPPLALVVDEFGFASRDIKRWWSDLRAVDKALPVAAPGLDAVLAIAGKGREGGVHLVLATQQANAGVTDGTELRDNFGAVLHLGAASQESAKMVFGRTDRGRDIPTYIPGMPPTEENLLRGRGTYVEGGRSAEPYEVQTFATPRPRTSGKVKPGDEAFFDAVLTRACQHLPAEPAGRLAQHKPTHLTLDALAAAVRDDDEVPVLLDGDRVYVVSVVEPPEDDPAVAADLGIHDGDGVVRYLRLTREDDTTFELAGTDD